MSCPMSDYADSIGQDMGQGIDLILGLWTRNLMNFGIFLKIKKIFYLA